jgi:hypothetical protein
MSFGRYAVIVSGLVAVLAWWAVPATAGDWGGHYGDILLSFTPGPAATHVARRDSLPVVGTMVDLYALLSVPEAVRAHGEQVLSVGGLELKLAVDGAPGCRVVSQEITGKNINVGAEPGTVTAGLFPGVDISEGTAQLVHWVVQVPGLARDVVFRLDPAGVRSCDGLPGCAGSGSFAMWAGTAAANQHGLLFSAGYVPAYLNPTTPDPDLTPRRGKVDWRERGLVTPDRP